MIASNALLAADVVALIRLPTALDIPLAIPVGSMNAGVQKAVQSLQRSVQLTTSVNPDKTVGGIKNNPIFKDQGFDYDRFERIQRKIAKENGNKPVFLDTKRIDRPLPKGAVPQVCLCIMKI